MSLKQTAIQIGYDAAIYGISKYGLEKVNAPHVHMPNMEDIGIYIVADLVYDKCINRRFNFNLISDPLINMRLERFVFIGIGISAINMFLEHRSHRFYDNLIALGASEAVQGLINRMGYYPNQQIQNIFSISEPIPSEA
jgi:hypothetical protein